MSDDELLFAACLADPAEDTLRLALADWFDEHNEHDMAAELRAGRKGMTFLAELVSWQAFPTAPVHSYENGAMRAAFSARVAARLLTRYRARFPIPPGARIEYQEDAPRQQKYTDPLNPAGFLYQWQRERCKQIAAIRELAARNADKPHGPHTFRAEPGARDFEEQSCLLHELVLRGRAPAVCPGALEHHARMSARGHPLVRLPLRLLAPESDVARWLPFSGGWSSPGGAVAAPGHATPAGTTAFPAIAAAEYLDTASPLFAAVCQWADESNGQLEGIVFRFDGPLTAAPPAWLSALPAESLGGATVTAATLGAAFGELFGAAQNGGAYGHSRWGAYGRLNAWKSLGALCDRAPGAGADEIAASALRCEWFTFAGDWFNHICGDLGVICLRPDRRSVALLAATDTD